MKEAKEGYYIFVAEVNEDRGYAKAAMILQEKINHAEKEFDIVFLSGPSFRDDSGARNVYFASQGACLTRKKK